MLAWLCGLSSQHKGRSVDEGLASAWVPASVICPRQPLTEPRGGWAWAGHGGWRWGTGGRGYKGGMESQLWGEGQLPPSSFPSLYSHSLAAQSVIQQTTSPSYKETGSLSQCSSSECCFRTFLTPVSLHNVQVFCFLPKTSAERNNNNLKLLLEGFAPISLNGINIGYLALSLYLVSFEEYTSSMHRLNMGITAHIFSRDPMQKQQINWKSKFNKLQSYFHSFGHQSFWY